MSTFSENVRSARESKGWTQSQLAERMNVKKGAVGNWEIGKNMLPGEDMIRLAQVLDTTVTELLGETEAILKKYGAKNQPEARGVMVSMILTREEMLRYLAASEPTQPTKPTKQINPAIAAAVDAASVVPGNW